jgi:two-component system chemotaxis response regulator CheY
LRTNLKIRILVADDEIVARNRLRAILRSYGDCDSVTNGKDALESVTAAWQANSPYDLLFLDIEMPQMDGLSVLREIRNQEASRDLPPERKIKIVMTTAHADGDVVTQCIREGCSDYIVKPVSIGIVAKKIARFL